MTYEPNKPKPAKCEKCGHYKRKDCDGKGWLEALGPYRDGSYITSRPCPYDNPFAGD